MALHTNTALANGLRELLHRLEQHIDLRVPINVFLAGGMAVHLYTASRTTCDVDAEFSSADPNQRVRMIIPADIAVEIEVDGVETVVYFDTNYNSTFALMHEDYMDDALPVQMGMEKLRLHVLSPVDLVVSKVARFADNDREDIESLVRHGLTTADEIERRAHEALGGFVGNTNMLLHNIRDAVALAHKAEAEAKKEADARIESFEISTQYRPSLNFSRHSYKQALAPEVGQEWSPEHERRASMLPGLQAMATGALFTFAELGSQAMDKAGAAKMVDWKVVENAAIKKAMLEDHQSADDVYRAIAGTSPGVISEAQQTALKERIAAIQSVVEVLDDKPEAGASPSL